MSEGKAHVSRPRVIGAWWRGAVRSALLLRVSWAGLQATPGGVASVVVGAYLTYVLIERLLVPGDATFQWSAVLVGWLSPVVKLWLCWVLVSLSSTRAAVPPPPGAATLFSMMTLQLVVLYIVFAVLYIPLSRMGLLSFERIGLRGLWIAWSVPMTWLVVAQTKLVWQSRPATRGARMVVAAGLAVLVLGVQLSIQLPLYWSPVEVGAAERRPTVTLEQFERQGRLLPEQLQALAAERPGVVDVYAITYAPYDEDVFPRESAMVADVMAERFDAADRTIRLVNRIDAIGELPWATPANLKQSIERMASLMNRDEDVLVIHLTSHGASDGRLATRMGSLSLKTLTPVDLARWLDDAGIRYRVVSVSACYSGSWIAPLSGDGTLVMTAADADHTSFGCGSRSELTFFGRAVFDEQLRRTWSFEEAHAAARVVIDAREKAAGKTDGYSNPQISVGAAVRRQLVRLADERAKAAAP